jgi:hypothetical protein
VDVGDEGPRGQMPGVLPVGSAHEAG